MRSIILVLFISYYAVDLVWSMKNILSPLFWGYNSFWNNENTGRGAKSVKLTENINFRLAIGKFKLLCLFTDLAEWDGEDLITICGRQTLRQIMQFLSGRAVRAEIRHVGCERCPNPSASAPPGYRFHPILVPIIFKLWRDLNSDIASHRFYNICSVNATFPCKLSGFWLVSWSREISTP